MTNYNFNNIIPCLKEYGVTKAAVFGSVARGEDKNNSDIDIIVSFRNKECDLFDIAGLKLDLEYILRKTVDIITYEALDNDDFSQNALREEILIYEEDF